MKPKIYFAMPAYDGRIEMDHPFVISQAAKTGMLGKLVIRGHSLLAKLFNSFWAEALNLRETDGITHFVMLHNDIVPLDDHWLETLVQEQQAVGADILSVVVPMKGASGLTSTGLFQPDLPDYPWAVQRLSLHEIHAQPETFTDSKLVVNSGCWIADITKPWAEKCHFEIRDRIAKIEGRFQEQVLSEDWNFSLQAREQGASIYATRKVPVIHVGRQKFPNSHVWGTDKTDPYFA